MSPVQSPVGSFDQVSIPSPDRVSSASSSPLSKSSHDISSPTAPTHPMITRGKAGIRKPKTMFSLHTVITNSIPQEPQTVSAALLNPLWRSAMQSEMDALSRNKTWTLVPKPPGINVIGSKWVFKTKTKADGSLDKCKARLVAQGYNQQPSIDCGDTYSPVVRPTTIHTVLSLAISRRWPIRQLDVKNAFLHGTLSERVYVRQPPGFIDSQFPDHVCQLHKSLYGLKQAPRAWYIHFMQFICKHGFINSRSDSSMFIFQQGSNIVILLLYVDDILTATSESLLQSVICLLRSEFAMTDLGTLQYFLGISVHRSADGLFLSQGKYIRELLQKFKLDAANPASNPVDSKLKLSLKDGDPLPDATLYRSMVGALQYITFTRPDIAFAVQQVCLFMHAPRTSHLQAAKRIFRHLIGTIDHGLLLRLDDTSKLQVYSDADWARCPDTRRSTSGYCVFLGSNLISWSSKRQHTVSRSSAEAQYLAVANAVSEAVHIRSLFSELQLPLPHFL